VSAEEPVAPGGPFGAVRAVLAAFALVLVANAVVLVATESPVQGLRLRGLQHLYQVGRLLGVALVVAGLVALCQRLRVHAGWRGYFILASCSVALGAFTLTEDAANFAGGLVPFAPQLGLGLVVVGVAVSVALAAWVGRRLDRPRLRWLAVLAGVAVLFVHPFVLETGYPGVHLYLAGAAVALIAGALVQAPVAKSWRHVSRALPWLMAAGVAAFTYVVPPSNSLQLHMLQQEGDVITPFVSRLAAGVGGGAGEVPAVWKPWFARRDLVEAIPASRPPTVADPIVILLTIDSLRADIIERKKHDKHFPTLAALRESSLNFTRARAPGSQTVYTLSELFMGKYFSQQYWTRHPVHRDLWPDDDASPRFPQLLSDAGVATVHYATTKWLTGDAGIIRGFTEEQFVEPAKTRYSLCSETFPLLMKRLEDHKGGPLFVYTHMLDAHYTVSPKPGANARRKYVANLEVVDDCLRQLLEELDRLKLRDRAFVIVSADHGEAFGEHNTHHHRYTIYEELLRVPLMIQGPGVKPRRVDTPVSVIDLGPTILDLFGQATPGQFMGESLVGFMRGGSPKLTRPIAAETRLKKSLVFPDEFKAIIDDRHGTAEVYDLRADPGELINLLDAEDPRATQRVDTVRAFFDTHVLDLPGYKPPFRA